MISFHCAILADYQDCALGLRELGLPGKRGGKEFH